MKQSKRKAFTLIELIAVLVIMAIIALIAIPLVMNIIRKARISADKRSIDAYGRSIELAIAGYLLDNGYFPTEISQLTIEYSGNKVECSTTQINSDSSVYLAGCTVAGRNIEGYTYGKEEVVTYKSYQVGNEVTYNNINYYVIKDSGVSEANVTLLKAEPLSAEEIATYSAGTGAETDGKGGMTYYKNRSDNCWNGDISGCTTNYESSQIKYVVDAWKSAKASTAIEARLIQYDEFENLGYVEGNRTPSDIGLVKSENTPSWVYSNYTYWTSSQYNDDSIFVWCVTRSGELIDANIHNRNDIAVRPVIVLPKSAL